MTERKIGRLMKWNEEQINLLEKFLQFEKERASLTPKELNDRLSELRALQIKSSYTRNQLKILLEEYKRTHQ